jgi:molecular chaperone DnaK (HSP70)
MDTFLCEYVQRQLYMHQNDDDIDTKVHQNLGAKLKSINVQNQLRMSCKEVKEELCGGNNEYDEELIYPPSVQVSIPPSLSSLCAKSSKIHITQEDFQDIISPIVTKASKLIEKTLDQCNLSSNDIDEVILVGGATKTPSIRKMLQQQFTKSVELCASIDPYSAVAQGAAIYGAIVSDLVPKYELRNALMLDALPHPIGVLTLNENGEEDYVPILERGMELPAMNCATFQLKDVYQKGVTIVAVEDVGDEFPLERVGSGDGTFTFLLHRLSDEKLKEMEKSGQGRQIQVGMTVETSGRFIVSIFDENDPEHLEKKRRYQEWKNYYAKDDNADIEHTLGPMTNFKGDKLGMEEVLLIIGCTILFLLYVGTKMAFMEPTVDVNEL